VLDGGVGGRAAVPSGASTGSREALELRDGGKRYGGKGVRKAVGNVHDEIAPRLHGMDARDQARIDRSLIELDGTPDKSRLGANAMVAVSLACAHADAASKKMPLWKKLAGERRVGLPVPQIMHLFAFKPDRTEFLSRFTQGVMRGPSPLSPGLRELIAAFTSRRNDCLF